MATYTSKVDTGSGSNFRGGSSNSGSHMVGWDSGNVRSERFRFKTGAWPVTQISFTAPATSVYQGTNIGLRYGISTSSTAYVNSSGTSSGYSLTKNAKNTRAISLKANTVYYITFFPATKRSDNFGLLHISNSSFQITLTEFRYTKCGAPTTLTLTNNILVPEDTTTLSWSGATAGTNLTIGSYDVYRSTSIDGEYTKINGDTVITDTSYVVQASETRGESYYYKVITKPAEDVGDGDFDSDLSVASEGLKANTRPGTPTINETIPELATIPSSGGDITFKLTSGNDVDGQTLTTAYSTSPGGTKTSITNNELTVTLTNATTFYFWTYDGLEYSESYVSKAISKNVKPSIESFSGSATLYNALGSNGATGSQIGYANNPTFTLTTNKSTNCNIVAELEYYSSDDTNPWNSSSATQTTIMNSSVNSTSLSLNFNIHEYITLGARNIHWRIRFKIQDNLESSGYKYFPGGNGGTETTTYYSIAHGPSLNQSNIINRFDDETVYDTDIAGTIHRQVWRKVCLKVYNDSSVPITSASVKINNVKREDITVSTTIPAQGVYRYIKITLPDDIAGGALISITVDMKDSESNPLITKSVHTDDTQYPIKETKVPVLSGSLTHGAATIKPFSSSGDFFVSAGWPFGSSETVDSTTLAAYNCSTTASNAIRLVLSRDQNGSNKVIKTTTWSKGSNETITGSFNRSTFYEWNKSLGINYYRGTVNYYCKLEIENLFGKVVSTNWFKDGKFNFNELPKNLNITGIEYSLTDPSDSLHEAVWRPLGNYSIQQGMYLRITSSFDLYTDENTTVSILLQNNSQGSPKRGIECYDSVLGKTRSTPITYKGSDSSQQSELTFANNRNPVTNTRQYIYYVSSEIKDNDGRNWYVQVKNTSGMVESLNALTTSVIKQTKPTINFSSCTVNSSYDFTYAYLISDNGGGVLSTYLCDDTSTSNPKVQLTSELANNQGTVRTTEEDPSWESKTISVEIKSKVTQNLGNGIKLTNVKYYYSNEIVVFKVSPTIAYRKNQIGVNTDNPVSGAIVDIHQSTGKEFIVIQGVDTNNKINKFEINPITGEIKFYFDGTLKNTANLKQGFLT